MSESCEVSARANVAGYSLVSLFQEHGTEDGNLAFADAVFSPSKSLTHYSAHYVSKPNLRMLEKETEMLRNVCEERLAGTSRYLPPIPRAAF